MDQSICNRIHEHQCVAASSDCTWASESLAEYSSSPEDGLQGRGSQESLDLPE